MTPHRHIIKPLALAALLLGAASSGRADTTSFTAIALGGVDNTKDGTFDTLSTLVRTGGNATQEWRWALEFDLASLPAGAVISSASLRLRAGVSVVGTAQNIALSGYLADGTIVLADMVAGTHLLSFTPTGAATAYDVSSFVQGSYSASQNWLGFNLRQSLPHNNSVGLWWSPTDAAASAPLLTVEYSLAAVPEPQTWALMLLGLGLVARLGGQRRC